MKHLSSILVLALLATLALSSPVFAQGAVGPPGGTIYASDQMFETVATPRDLPNRGKFDTIYALGHGLANVADAAPGEMEYNGGRWEVRPIEFLTISPTQFTNADQVHAAAMAGQISIGDVVRRFECPLIPKD